MLQITIPSTECWDEEKQEFITEKEQVLQLEHSLVSISKWEARWEKAFLSKTPMSNDELLDYVRCMTLTQNVHPDVYFRLTNKNLTQIEEYINAPMTATCVFDDKNAPRSTEKVTAELIYYWMIALNIPFECQKWHLNRLLMLIKVCNIKNKPPKKMSQRELLSRNAAINAARRKQLNTRG